MKNAKNLIIIFSLTGILFLSIFKTKEERNFQKNKKTISQYSINQKSKRSPSSALTNETDEIQHSTSDLLMSHEYLTFVKERLEIEREIQSLDGSEFTNITFDPYSKNTIESNILNESEQLELQSNELEARNEEEASEEMDWDLHISSNL